MRGCRTIALTTVLLCLGEGLMAQDPVKGNVQGIHGGRLQVVSVLPDSFPSIGLVLRAEDSTGTPFWDLHRDQVRVTENGAPCAVTCIYPITYPAPIHIALVIDHSGSMAFDGSYMEDSTLLLEWMTDTAAYQRFLDTTESPLDHARNGVLGFIQSFDTRKDAMSIAGFSDTVDVRVPLTNDTAELVRTVRALEPTQSTALYDAVLVGLDQLKGINGLRVLVVLTDGLDNSSAVILDDVIDRAVHDSVPVFTIGLGSANRSALDSLATLTGGRAYFTREPSTLASLYAEISRNIQAYYHLAYLSKNLTSTDTSRDVEIRVDFGDSALQDDVAAVLPNEVLAVLAAAERERTWTWGGGMAALIATGTLLAYRYRRKRKPMVTRIWPVPTNGELFVDLDAIGGEVLINDATMTVSKKFRISNGVNHYDLSAMMPGNYTLTVSVPGKEPELYRILKL